MAVVPITGSAVQKINGFKRFRTLPLKQELLAKAQISLSSESKYIPVNIFSCFSVQKFFSPQLWTQTDP
jgi:hypothetical protein